MLYSLDVVKHRYGKMYSICNLSGKDFFMLFGFFLSTTKTSYKENNFNVFFIITLLQFFIIIILNEIMLCFYNILST